MVGYDRRTVMAAVLGAAALGTAALLARVLGTVFFAITIAYVLYPVRTRLTRRGLDSRVAAGLSTALAFVVALALAAPIVVVLYFRRTSLLALVGQLPEDLSVSLFGYTYAVELSELVVQARGTIVDLAVDLARASPVIALKAFLFTFVVYALLLRPDRTRHAVFGLVPGTYHDVAERVHVRVRDTLYAIYILQAATAFVTFLVAYLVFWGLGYQFPFALAVIAGILQFVPIVGPSILVLGIAGVQVIEGDVASAALLLAVGLVLVGFAPDAVVRPYLAERTTELPASLYFVGFTGGVLSLGVIGFIAGPLAIAVLAEIAEIVSTPTARQQTLEAAGSEDPPPESAAGVDPPADRPAPGPGETDTATEDADADAASDRTPEGS